MRTLAANGNGEVEPTFRDFHRLALFTHLEQAYHDAAWVRIDGDDAGRKIVASLQERYPTWAADRFGIFPDSQFEAFYPAHFAEKVAALAEMERGPKREAKRALLDEVRDWLDEDIERGKAALQESAWPIIADLRDIESQLVTQPTRS